VDGAVEVVHAVEIVKVAEGRKTTPVVEGMETTTGSEIPAHGNWLGNDTSDEAGSKKERRSEAGEHGDKN